MIPDRLTVAATRATFAKRALIVVLAVAGVAYSGACAYLWMQQRALIFFPETAIRRTPSDIGIKFQELNIPVAGGGVINAWWLPLNSNVSAGATVLYLHGNEGNLGTEIEHLGELHRLGLAVLAIDYRGYGKSSGPPPSESRLYEDAAAAWDYLVRTDGFQGRRIILYGHSLGGAVAVELALHLAPACGVVLESTFTSMAEMGRSQYPLIPVDLLLAERFDTLNKIDNVKLPILLVHGTADRIVPVEMTMRLFQAAREPKEVVLVDGAGHEDALQLGGQQIAEAIADLAHRCADRGP